MPVVPAYLFVSRLFFFFSTAYSYQEIAPITKLNRYVKPYGVFELHGYCGGYTAPDPKQNLFKKKKKEAVSLFLIRQGQASPVL